MAIRFLLPEQEGEAVAFAYSPVVEAVLSLHVLVAPKHHPLQHGWVRRMRTLDPQLRAEVRAFQFVYRDHFPDFLFPRPDEEFLSFEEELTHLHGLDEQSLAFEFLRPLYDHQGERDPELLEREDVRTHVRRWADRLGNGSSEVTELIFEDPAKLARRFCALLERYWNEAFEDEWARIEPGLADAVQEAGRRLPAAGVLGLLSEHRPRLQIDGERGAFWLKLEHEHEVVVSQATPLVLSPSVFVWPHIRVNCDPPFPVGLIYPAPSVLDEAGPRLPPGELLTVLHALADDTRLRALALIAERPRSTQELAPLVGLTEAGLSKHLRTLADAGIVETRRDGYYVLYSLVPDRVRPISAALLQFLSQGE